jgi:Tol biopolymer transport system component
VDASPDDRINLTYSGKFVEETRPRWSPDGLWIAYVTHNIVPEETDPFSENPTALIALDAGCVKATETCLDSRRLLSQDGHSVADFAWSPDSRYLVYLQGEWLGAQNPVGDLWVVELDSGEVTQLTEGQTSAHFTWSPDSRAVVYERVTENSLDVYLAYVDGSRDPGPVPGGFRASATPYWARQH